eukprot:1160675-Pelagomonas_calceolata.AAC.16
MSAGRTWARVVDSLARQVPIVGVWWSTNRAGKHNVLKLSSAAAAAVSAVLAWSGWQSTSS